MHPGDDGALRALHDAAYRYAFRRSLSGRLASTAALEAVESVPHAERVTVLLAARAALERYLPPALPPRIEGDVGLRAALAALAPGEREFLLLHHWDGLAVEDAARASGQEAGRLALIERACARGMHPDRFAGIPTDGDQSALSEGQSAALSTALSAALSAADPAHAISDEDLARSRDALPATATDASPEPAGNGQENPDEDSPAQDRTGTVSAAERDHRPAPSAEGRSTDGRSAGAARRRIRTVVAGAALVAVVAALAVALVPKEAPGPASAVERLYDLADVVAVVSESSVAPAVVDGDLRILQKAAVVQLVKGEAEQDVLTIDITGRSTLERPYSRNFYAPDQLMFLVRDRNGVLSPIDGEGSVLVLIDRRSPEARTTTGDPAPLPDELAEGIDALPEQELALDTSGREPGAQDPEAVVGILPTVGRDSQNLPAYQLGFFRISADDATACVVFEFNSRSILLRWPEGFSAYERRELLSYPDGDPRVGRRVLTVLNDRGYPYVDQNRPTPFIRGTATGGRGTCGGQDLEVWDIAVEPGSTLLFY